MTTLAPTETQLIDRIEEVGAKIEKVRETTASIIFGQERVIVSEVRARIMIGASAGFTLR